MAKVGNFSKETLKNGAKVVGGHRVKYVSEDKTFVILLTSYGYFYGVFLKYDADGAYVDDEKTPRQSKELCFDSLEDCKKYWKVGEFVEAEEVKEEEPKSNEAKVLKAYKNGQFFEYYGKDAEKVSEVLGIPVIGSGEEKSVGHPAKDQYSCMAKLVKAGYKVKVIENGVEQKAKPVKPLPTKEKKAAAPKKADAVEEPKKLEIASPIESKGMEAMREAFVKMCDEQKFDIDKTCIKQSKEDTSHGTLVGYKDKKAVVETAWYRKEEGKERKYYMA